VDHRLGTSTPVPEREILLPYPEVSLAQRLKISGIVIKCRLATTGRHRIERRIPNGIRHITTDAQLI
jgi:hypothetical protein